MRAMDRLSLDYKRQKVFAGHLRQRVSWRSFQSDGDALEQVVSGRSKGTGPIESGTISRQRRQGSATVVQSRGTAQRLQKTPPVAFFSEAATDEQVNR